MAKYNAAQDYLKKLPDFQRKAVESLLSQTTPVNPTPSVARQWIAWLILSILVAAFSEAIIKPQVGLLERLAHFPSGPFLALVFLGSALAAWFGIASSMPGEEPGAKTRLFMGGFLLFLFSMPFLFFQPDDIRAVLAHDCVTGFFCFRTVVLVAIPSWSLLGWMVSRNASFKPGWTGAWLGVSAFLLGTGVAQAHCSHWECCHMLVNHLLPLVLFLFLPIWAGSYWFSRWKRKN
jgi:hypothetical protein